MRERIWATLVNLRFKGFILDMLVDAFQQWDRRINIFLALTSSGSIAAWAIWKEHEMVWPMIIAASQVVTVIKPYFPYYKYVKELNAKSLRADNLNIEFERLWDKVQGGKSKGEEAAEAYYALQKELNEVFSFGDETMFKVTNGMKRQASERTKSFLQSNYGITINLDNQTF